MGLAVSNYRKNYLFRNRRRTKFPVFQARRLWFRVFLVRWKNFRFILAKCFNRSRWTNLQTIYISITHDRTAWYFCYEWKNSSKCSKLVPTNWKFLRRYGVETCLIRGKMRNKKRSRNGMFVSAYERVEHAENWINAVGIFSFVFFFAVVMSRSRVPRAYDNARSISRIRSDEKKRRDKLACNIGFSRDCDGSAKQRDTFGRETSVHTDTRRSKSSVYL